MVPGQPSARRDIQGESSLFLSISDNYKDRKVGARSRDQAMFPTMDQEIDAIKDLWKREQVSQANLTGKTLAVEVARGAIATDLSDWCVHGALPADTYRIWTLTASWDAQVVRRGCGAARLRRRYYRPGNPLRIATEAFYVNPGLLRAYYWDLEIQREHQSVVATAAQVEARPHRRPAGRQHLGDEEGDISKVGPRSKSVTTARPLTCRRVRSSN